MNISHCLFFPNPGSISGHDRIVPWLIRYAWKGNGGYQVVTSRRIERTSIGSGSLLSMLAGKPENTGEHTEKQKEIAQLSLH